MTNPPFFTIGVTTYDRSDLLKQTLESLLNQTFTDFEVIIANDNPSRQLSEENLGLSDRRLKFVNHKENLGEWANMNKLLDLANGHYFVWLADDDLFHPQYLEECKKCLDRLDSPNCVFAAYEVIYGTGKVSFIPCNTGEWKIFSGKEFLRAALGNSIKTIGNYAVYNTEYLRHIGGYPDISEHDDLRGLYGEYMLIIKVGTLPVVPFLQNPLIFYRAHPGSWGSKNTLLDLHRIAGQNLVKKSFDILIHPNLYQDLVPNLTDIMALALMNLGNICLRSGEVRGFKLLRELKATNYSALFAETPEKKIAENAFKAALKQVKRRMTRPIVSDLVRCVIPNYMIELIQKYRSSKK
jgi:glycosyltransferase involved in cell wall biosynthesis